MFFVVIKDKIPYIFFTFIESVSSFNFWLNFQACSMLALVKYVIKIKDKAVNVGDELATLYAGELNPVAAKAQRKVPVPEGYVHFFHSNKLLCLFNFILLF